MDKTTLAKCNRCGWSWAPRLKRHEQDSGRPVACPNCQSRAWDAEKNPRTEAKA